MHKKMQAEVKAKKELMNLEFQMNMQLKRYGSAR